MFAVKWYSHLSDMLSGSPILTPADLIIIFINERSLNCGGGAHIEWLSKPCRKVSDYMYIYWTHLFLFCIKHHMPLIFTHTMLNIHRVIWNSCNHQIKLVLSYKLGNCKGGEGNSHTCHSGRELQICILTFSDPIVFFKGTAQKTLLEGVEAFWRGALRFFHLLEGELRFGQSSKGRCQEFAKY